MFKEHLITTTNVLLGASDEEPYWVHLPNTELWKLKMPYV
jgi:hypothetical protein